MRDRDTLSLLARNLPRTLLARLQDAAPDDEPAGVIESAQQATTD
jgi:hypothetical protein